MVTVPTEFGELLDEGKELKLVLHPGQSKVWRSTRRIVAVICSTQWGKTVLGPLWLDREMYGDDTVAGKGPGDYLAVTATYPLLRQKMLMEMDKLFVKGYGKFEWKAADMMFVSHEKIGGAPAYRIIVGSATNPESLESATAKAAWLDEAGQHQFSRQAWEAVLRRLSISRGRVLITSTPYEFGWFKQEIYDRWRDGDQEIEVIQGYALDNPVFPREEYERQQELLPRWKFLMIYHGQFEKPAGLIYDAFDETQCIIPRQTIPFKYKCYVGHDFGPNNTAAVWYAQDPDTSIFYVYRAYLAGGLSAYEHAQKFKELSKGENIIRRVGGSQTEDGWREAFTAAGWPIAKPREREVEVGINIVYGWHRDNRIYVFNDVDEYLEEKREYARELGDDNQPTEKIANKSRFHIMDAERYVISDLGPERVVARKGARVEKFGDSPIGHRRPRRAKRNRERMAL